MAIGLGSLASVTMSGAGNAGCVLNARKMRLRLENEVGETTAFSPTNNMRDWIPTKRRATLTVEGFLDGTTNVTAFDTEIVTTARTAGSAVVNFGGTGTPKFSFSGFVSFAPSSVVDGVNTYTTTIRGTGAITGATVP